MSTSVSILSQTLQASFSCKSSSQSADSTARRTVFLNTIVSDPAIIDGLIRQAADEVLFYKSVQFFQQNATHNPIQQTKNSANLLAKALLK